MHKDPLLRHWAFDTVVLIMVLLPIAVAGVDAQEIRDPQNRLLYQISEEIEVISSQNILIWRIHEDGVVKTAQNVMLLRLMPDGKVVSASNVNIGRIEKGGSKWTAQNRKMGLVTFEGRIMSPQNVVLAKAYGIDRVRAALIWFFLRPPEKEGSPAK